MASKAVLKGVTLSDRDVNNSTSELVTSRRTAEELGNTHTSSPSSSGVSEEGDEEDSKEIQSNNVSTSSTAKNGVSRTRTRGTPQEKTALDNDLQTPRTRHSASASLSQTNSSPGPIGRSVGLHLHLG